MSGPRFNALDMIAQRESAWRNVPTSAWNPTTGFNQSTGGITGPSTASGYWQITNTTWRAYAPGAGVDTTQYPTAMSAPYDVQRSVAGTIYERRGFADWAPYNSAIRADLARNGASAYGADYQVAPNNPVGNRLNQDYSNNPNSVGSDGVTPSGYDTSGDRAPGYNSADEMNSQRPQQFAASPNENTEAISRSNGFDNPPDENANAVSRSMQQPDGLTGNTVTAPQAGQMGVAASVATAIVTAANQESTTIANAARATAEAALKSAQTITTSDKNLQSNQQGWASNWAVRIFMFIIGAIFVAGSLFLLGKNGVENSIKQVTSFAKA
jgi:hypothetical protein